VGCDVHEVGYRSVAFQGNAKLDEAKAAKRWRVGYGNERFAKARRVNPPNFFAELKRRNVYKVAIAWRAADLNSTAGERGALLYDLAEAPPSFV
jgi:hypothetical protein